MSCKRPHLSNEEYIVMALQQNRGNIPKSKSVTADARLSSASG